MGMWTQPELFTDHFQFGDEFVLQEASCDTIPTDFGEAKRVTLTIEGKQYSIIGVALHNAVERMTDGDLPRRCAIVLQKTRGGNNMKVFEDRSQQAQAKRERESEDAQEGMAF